MPSAGQGACTGQCQDGLTSAPLSMNCWFGSGVTLNIWIYSAGCAQLNQPGLFPWTLIYMVIYSSGVLVCTSMTKPRRTGEGGPQGGRSRETCTRGYSLNSGLRTGTGIGS